MPVTEDLISLAAAQFATAQTLCGPCRKYHAIWPSLRLAGAVGGVEADERFLAPVLEAHIARGARDVLLAGSADSGVLALVHRAFVRAGHAPRIQVLDRCATPLRACEQHAARHGIALRTILGDLTRPHALPEVDLVVGHSVLPFLQPAERPAVLTALAAALRPGGSLLMTVRVVPAGAAAPARRSTPPEMARLAIRTLADRRLPLPCAEADFSSLVADFFLNSSYQVCRFEALDTLLAEMAACGLAVQAPVALGPGYKDIRSASDAGQAMGWACIATRT